MDVTELTLQMETNAEVIRALVRGLTEERVRWRPEPGAWSVLEVVNHLGDEEREDFRTRLDIMLHRPHEPFPKIDPQGWVQARRYNERDVAASIERFINERGESLRWLRALESPDWSVVHRPSRFGMNAGDMLSAWVAHDVLHMRQLVRLKWAQTERLLGPHRLDYAGTW